MATARIREGLGLAHLLRGVRALGTSSSLVGAPPSATIYEVGPRDGLQNELEHVPTEKKIKLIDLLSSTGLTHIEVSAFVHPKLVPQMADAADVIRGIKRAPGVSYSTLVPNVKGLQRALEAASNAGTTLGEIAIFTSASEEFNEKNLNMSISKSLAGFEPIMKIAEGENTRVRGYVSVAMGCPYASKVSADTVSRIAKTLMDLGCYEVSLGDTVGLGTPKDVVDLVRSCVDKQEIPVERIALHLHDTRNMAIANVYAGLQEGVRVFDASIGGLGGCPFAATSSNGNLATEDLLYLLHGLGISTGVDFDKVLEVSQYVESAAGLNLTNQSRVARQALRIEE